MDRTSFRHDRDASAGSPWRRGAWWVCLIALTSQVFLPMAATPAAALFVVVVVLNVAATPARCLGSMTRDPIPWIYPAIALASTLWSDAPLVSLRLALELCVTTGAMIALGRQLPLREVISALMLALLLGAGASLLVTSPASVMHADVPVIGIFGSKNLLAFHMVVLVLAAGAVAFDAGQPRLLRGAAFGAIALGLMLTLAARSAGATLMGSVAIMVFLVVVALAAMPRRARTRLLAVGVVTATGIGALVAAAGPDLLGQVLGATGKDSSLTGRTELWARAWQLINERPGLGYGYQAFWRQDYTEAEGLWRIFKIKSRMGFHFHNLYYESTIELGLFGLAGLLLTLVVFAVRTGRVTLRAPSAETGFRLALCTLLLMRTGIEVDLGFPFGIAAALFPILLTYRPRAVPQAIPALRTRSRPRRSAAYAA